MPMPLAPQAGQQRRSVTVDSEALRPVVQDKLLKLDFAFSPCQYSSFRPVKSPAFHTLLAISLKGKDEVYNSAFTVQLHG